MLPVIVGQIAMFVVVLLGLVHAAAGMVWVERKEAARMQQRVGPTRVGPAGLLQPFADVLKLLFKENLRPAAADVCCSTSRP